MATNEAGTASLTASLEVQQPPVAKFAPDENYLFAREGSPIVIECTATGYPTPSVEIKTPQGQSSHSFDDGPASRGPVQSVGSARISISRANTNHDGVYECVATNSAGKDIKFTRVQVGRGDMRKLRF